MIRKCVVNQGCVEGLVMQGRVRWSELSLDWFSYPGTGGGKCLYKRKFTSFSLPNWGGVSFPVNAVS